MELTEQQKDILKEIEFEFLFKDGYIQDQNNKDVFCMAIAKFKNSFFDSYHYLIHSKESGHIGVNFRFYEQRQFENVTIGKKYLFFNDNSHDPVYSELSGIENGSDFPFITSKGFQFKFIEELV